MRQVTTLMASKTSQQAQGNSINLRTDIRDRITEMLDAVQEEGFLTRSSLVDLLNIETVKGVIGDAGKIPTLAEFIIARALSVFAILIKMDKPNLIKSFHRDDFNENMLPITYNGNGSDWSVKSYFNKASSTASDVALQEIFTQDGWTYSNVADFCSTNQWLFFPLVFTEEKFRYQISSKMRLPYTPTTAAEDLKTAHSNNSRVEKRSIYRECFKTSIVRVLVSRCPVVITPWLCPQRSNLQ